MALQRTRLLKKHADALKVASDIRRRHLRLLLPSAHLAVCLAIRSPPLQYRASIVIILSLLTAGTIRRVPVAACRRRLARCGLRPRCRVRHRRSLHRLLRESQGLPKRVTYALGLLVQLRLPRDAFALLV